MRLLFQGNSIDDFYRITMRLTKKLFFALLAAALLLSGCRFQESTSSPQSVASAQPDIDPKAYAATRGTKTVVLFRLPSIFSDGMILQRQQPIHIYGEARNGQPVTAALSTGDTMAAEAAGTAAPENGSFILSLPPMEAGTGYTLTVTCGDDARVFRDVSIGEVFLCGGQSNMQLTMDDTVWYGDYYTSRIPSYPDNPAIKQFLVELDGSDVPKFDCRSEGWTPAVSSNLPRFAPLAYFFAGQVQEALQVPVGLVMSSAGGSPIQTWYKKEDQLADTDTDGMFYAQRGHQYNAMIAPLMPYSFSAVLWYQGESNASYDDPVKYAAQQQELVASWRRELWDPTIPFYIAELAGWNDDRFALLRESQRIGAEAMENVHLISNSDLGDPVDIHPRTKDILARRFANAYLALEHDMSLPYLAPIPLDIAVEEEQVVITFANVYDGLKTTDGSEKVAAFQLAGADGRYYPADAVLAASDKVIVTCQEVPSPATVRFSFKGYCQNNLTNSAGIAPYPFRTDTVVLDCPGIVLNN